MRNFKFMNNHITSLLLSGALAFTLVGCASSKENVKDDISADQVSEVIYQESNDSIIKSNLDNADSAVEAAIGIMLEGGDKLVQDSKAATQTESYQKAKEEALDNFITLSEFLRGEREISGYSIDEVKEDTIEYAEEAWAVLDDDLEKIYPDYKEKLKEKGRKFLDWAEEKGTDLAAKGYDKYQELKEKTLEKTKKK